MQLEYVVMVELDDKNVVVVVVEEVMVVEMDKDDNEN
jgi:hypothetical protein